MRYVIGAIVVVLLFATPGFAQMATVIKNAPIYVQQNPPADMAPLRVAAVGTVLRVVSQEGEWFLVQYQDPQWGLRTGWVKSEFLTVQRPEVEPMDLSVRPQQPPSSQPPIQAQSYPRRATTWYRQHVVGRSGVTFGTETAPLAGVEVSGDVLPVMQVYGSFDWHQNAAPTSLQDAMDLINYYLGTNVELEIPAYVAMGGVKVIGPPHVVRPYGMGGFGVGRVYGKILLDGTDVTDLADELGYINKDDLRATKPLFEVGGGVVFSIARAYIDVSYRFRKLLSMGEPFNMSGVYAGAGVSF